MKDELFSISSIGVVSIYGIHIGMIPNEVSRILDSHHIKYKIINYGSEAISDIEFVTSAHVLTEGLPPCELTFRFRYGQNLSFIKAGVFYSELENSKRLYGFFLQHVEPLGLNIRKWDCTVKNKSMTYFYNWANSIEVSLKEKYFNNKQQNPVSLIVRPHEGQKMIAEVVRITNIVNPTKITGTTKTNKSNCKAIIVGIIMVLLAVSTLILCIRQCYSYDSKRAIKSGLYSKDTNSGSTAISAVYICTSPNAKKYHSTPNCRWLENCFSDIKEVSIDVAERQGKSPCKGCY